MNDTSPIRARGTGWRGPGPGARRSGRVLGAALLTVCGLLSAPPAFTVAQACPDVEVVFARGTGEPPGVGGVGRASVDSLRSLVGAKSVAVYPVNYAASSDFADRIEFARTVVDGIRDESVHVESMAANCPDTKMVLGGYSQGAAVTGFVTSPVIPAGVPASYAAFLPKPMPPEIASHVAAVTLFGEPSDQWMRQYGAPPITIGPLYAPKTIALCAPGDTICNGAAGGAPTTAHVLYPMNGMTGQAAGFAARHL